MNQALCRSLSRVVGTTLVCATPHSTAYQCETGVSNETPRREIAWAFPSPYHEEVTPDRFANVEKYRIAKTGWDLRQLVNLWRSTDQESWPWIWYNLLIFSASSFLLLKFVSLRCLVRCDRNPVGPHYIFINVNSNTLHQVLEISKADIRNNITVVIDSIDALKKHGITDLQLYACRCAIIESPLEQIDAENKILMLRDERIIVYDFAFLS